MTPIRPRHPNTYTGSTLDRISHRRTDETWLRAALSDPASGWVVFWKGQALLRPDAGGTEFKRAAVLRAEAAAAVREFGGPWVLLGATPENTALFAVDVSEADEPATRFGALDGVFAELRSAASMLPASDAAILAQARGLLHWRLRHRHCANCGTLSEPRHAGNTTLCPACGLQHFPRTDPAVIMLVTDGDRCLLAHSARFPNPTMFSTLAGFVEPGESLEEAVAREVFEEVGVRVADVMYHSSQPWPFPASLMLGFFARAVGDALTVDASEIAEARWFTRDQIRDPAAHGFTVPRGDSIARRLIEDWVDSA